MPDFLIINNLSEADAIDNWAESATFNHKNQMVDSQGNYVSETYAGTKYRLVSKQERDFSCLERGARGFIGVAAVICSLGLALFSTAVIELFTRQKEIIRFGVLVSPPTPLTNQEASIDPILPQQNSGSPPPHSAAEANDLLVEIGGTAIEPTPLPVLEAPLTALEETSGCQMEDEGQSGQDGVDTNQSNLTAHSITSTLDSPMVAASSLSYLTSLFNFSDAEVVSPEQQLARYNMCLAGQQHLQPITVPLGLSLPPLEWSEEDVYNHLAQGLPIYLRLIHPQDRYSPITDSSDTVLPCIPMQGKGFNLNNIATVFEPFVHSVFGLDTEELPENIDRIRTRDGVSEIEALCKYYIERTGKTENNFKKIILSQIFYAHANSCTHLTALQNLIKHGHT